MKSLNACRHTILRSTEFTQIILMIIAASAKGPYQIVTKFGEEKVRISKYISRVHSNGIKSLMLASSPINNYEVLRQLFKPKEMKKIKSGALILSLLLKVVNNSCLRIMIEI